MSAGKATLRKRIEVVAAVIQREGGDFLLARRPVGKAYAGYWEFPGGKIEHGESAADAIRRELHEELGIDAVLAYPWLTRDHDYKHAAVRLRFFRVVQWQGEPHGREAQQLAWQSAQAPAVAPMLPANGPILRALELPPVYGISNAAELGVSGFLQRLEHKLSTGLRLLQIREKQLPAAELAGLAAQAVKLAHRYGARVLVNDDAGLTLQAGADGVHLTAGHLMRIASRPALPWVGASCHDAPELARAAQIGVDFVVLGPVQATPSHPGARTLGWDNFSQLAADYSLPVYALGGMRPTDLRAAWQAGAHGIGMVRGAW
ncbi:MAG: Nudix family hydrolase [Pseudomonadota bacterium]